MPSPEDAPWEVYARQQFTYYGFPLWHAGPENDKAFGPREVVLGTVGWVDEGRFRHLFNTRQEKDDPCNLGRVPDGFERFAPPNMADTPPERVIEQPYIKSHSIKSVKYSGDMSGQSPLNLVSAGGELSFECSKEQGAILILDYPAMQEKFIGKRHIVNYMRTHFDSWRRYVKDVRGLDIAPEEIRLVSGTTKTTKWACSAFHGNCKNKQGSVNVDVGNAASINVSISIARSELPSSFYNVGPRPEDFQPVQSVPQITDGTDTGPAGRPTLSARNQCIFFNYFAAKKRLGLIRTIMQAAAGPHQLPPGGPDAEGNEPVAIASDDDSDIVEGPHRRQELHAFNPVAYLLDYILAKSEAELAIASDRDVIAIFNVDGIPEDIYAGLEERQPVVEVDEHGVGTVTVDMTWLNQKLACEVAAAPHDVEGGVGETGPTAFLPSEQPQLAPGEPQGRQPVAGPTGNPPEVKGEEEAGERDDPAVARRRKTALGVWEPAANGHTGSITSLAVSPDSQWVASGSDDTTIILWDTEDGTVVRKWESHGDIVWHLAFSPDSTRVASSGGEGRVMVWDVDSGELLGTLEGHTETIHSVGWSPDGSKLASGSDDMTVRIWDGYTYECLHVLEGHNAMVTFVLFSHNGQYLASGGADYNCRVWHVEAGTLHKQLTGHRGMVWTASFDPEDNRIATASDDGSVRVWKVETGEELVTLHEHHGPVWVVAFSEDGKQILSGSSDSTLKVCDSFSGERVVALEGHDSMVNAASYSPDGKYVASASSDNTVRLWRLRDGTNMKTFNEHNDKVTHALFSPDGLTLSSGSDDGTVRIRVLKDYVELD